MIPVTINSDTDFDDETITLTLRLPVNATFVPAGPTLTATGTITEDYIPSVSIVSAGAINEGETAVFTVSTDETNTSRTEALVINLTAADKSGYQFHLWNTSTNSFYSGWRYFSSLSSYNNE